MARSLNSIMSNISDMSHEVADIDFFGMIYSEFGMGKTVAAMKLAQELRGDGDILFCDSSDGWVALQDHDELRQAADVFRVTDPADLVVIANGLGSGKLKSKRKNAYSVLVLDESSSVFDAMLEAYLRDKHSLSPDEPMPEAEGKEYGPPTAAFESLLRKFHEVSGLHIILTAHAREVGDAKELRPSFPPKAYNVVMRKLHVCAALSARRKSSGTGANRTVGYERSVQLLPSAVVSAKSRIPGTPLKAEVDDFVDFVAAWVASENFVHDTQGEPEEHSLADDDEDEREELEGDDVPEEEEADIEAEQDADVNDIPDEEFTEAVLRENLKAMSIADIRKFAEEDYDINLDGVKKADAIERLVEHFFGEEQ